MSVVGKLATCILNNAYVWLVNKLFKDDLISKKKKGGGGGREYQYTISQNSIVLNILRKNISKDRIKV